MEDSKEKKRSDIKIFFQRKNNLFSNEKHIIFKCLNNLQELPGLRIAERWKGVCQESLIHDSKQVYVVC